jgi:hypothetical protein
MLNLVSLWVSFLFGVLLHWMKRAGLSKSSLLSGTATRWEWFELNAVTVGIRAFVACLFFNYWLSNPDAATKVFQQFGIPANLNLEPTLLSAGMFGLCCDVLVDWLTQKIPVLKSEIPPVNGICEVKKP